MDAFMDVDELFHLRNLFYQGAYDQVIADITPQGKPLVIRALIAKGDISRALSEIESLSPPSPALKLLAQYEAAKSAGDKSTVAEKALAIDASDSTSLVALGTILYNESQFEDALKVLNKHEQNLEAVALIVQIHLRNDRLDLARKEYTSAKEWADDSLLIQLIEAWVGLKAGGEKYQEAYYVYEELGSAPGGSTVRVLNGQAVCNIHLHRYPEAISSLQEALKKDPKNADSLANLVVATTLSGQDASAHLTALASAAPSHFLVKDLGEKSSLFDSAVAAFASA